jgi:hypothetical protein
VFAKFKVALYQVDDIAGRTRVRLDLIELPDGSSWIPGINQKYYECCRCASVLAVVTLAKQVSVFSSFPLARESINSFYVLRFRAVPGVSRMGDTEI